MNVLHENDFITKTEEVINEDYNIDELEFPKL